LAQAALDNVMSCPARASSTDIDCNGCKSAFGNANPIFFVAIAARRTTRLRGNSRGSQVANRNRASFKPGQAAVEHLSHTKAREVLNLEGLGALDQLPRLREGFYFAFHSAILAGWMATPSLLNTEDNEKSFANVSEVAGNSRIKMGWCCETTL
jgi:hypothetical protein